MASDAVSVRCLVCGSVFGRFEVAAGLLESTQVCRACYDGFAADKRNCFAKRFDPEHDFCAHRCPDVSICRKYSSMPYQIVPEQAQQLAKLYQIQLNTARLAKRTAKIRNRNHPFQPGSLQYLCFEEASKPEGTTKEKLKALCLASGSSSYSRILAKLRRGVEKTFHWDVEEDVFDPVGKFLIRRIKG